MRAPSGVGPTIDPRAAAEALWDSVVVGAGPAGALAAYFLAADGLRVLLVDRAAFPRGKVCGCCLSGAALRVLRRSGVHVETLGARPLHTVHLRCGDRAVRIDHRGGAAVSRAALDAALVVAAVRMGADFLPGCPAAVTPDGSVALRAIGGTHVARARSVVVADGLAGRALDGVGSLRSSVSRSSRIGCGVVIDDAAPMYQAGCVHMAVGSGGYVGLVRLEDDRLDVAAAFDPVFIRQRGGPGPAADAILNSCGLSTPDGLTTAAWKGTPALTRRRRRLQVGPVFVVGDAAAYVEPFTGEGIGWAMESAEAVAPLVSHAVREGVRPDADDWTSAHARLLTRRRRACGAVAWALRRPRLVRAAIVLLDRVPALATPLVRTINRVGPHPSPA